MTKNMLKMKEELFEAISSSVLRDGDAVTLSKNMLKVIVYEAFEVGATSTVHRMFNMIKTELKDPVKPVIDKTEV